VDAKGRVTNLTTTLIAVPSSLLLFGGDVTGSGNTGSSVLLTLQTVNPNVYPSNTFLKFAVNGKGLVTSAAPITNLDIESVLGYVPVPNSRTITINGLTQDLSSNRSWTIAAALPPQAGNAGKYLFTDGIVATWQPVSSPILDLQQVTDIGNVTTNNIIVGVVGGDEATLGTSFLYFSKQSNSVSGINSADTFGYLKIPDSGVTEQIIPVSVNGQFADSLGDITIPVGTVTSVAALTLGTTGTDLNSTVANGTTTPVITLNVPTASATNRGALSSADWSTFDGKQNALGYTPVTDARTLTINGVAYDLTADRSWSITAGVSSVSGTAPIASSGGSTPAISITQATSSTDGYLSSTDWNEFNNKAPIAAAVGNNIFNFYNFT
jgi:hypothetical protein